MSSSALILGHRGASARAPENTLAAFDLARRMGADGVELDARRTADDVLVVHHDPHVGDFGLLREQPFAALRAAHPAVPTLAEALDACAGMIVNVEIKCLPWEPDTDDADRTVVHAVADLIRETGTDAIVSSFDLGAVDACHAYASEIVTAWLTSGQDLVPAGMRASKCGHQWLHPDRLSALRASPAAIERVHRLGLKIDVWTVDDPHEARELVDNGVDGICTNAPDVVRAALA
jgi:glycerophosphoryl diester phosphodiesterase